MCGIAGFTHRSGRREADRIRKVTETLRHRGPDQSGVWDCPIISMGAVRLKIIDLEGGDQPIASCDGNTVIAFNGEIYNHAELRTELESLGHRFRSRCDTEVVLEAFRRWDVHCFAKLRGMFGVALWQHDEKRLVLARDRVGIKPLYVHRRGEDLYFASELKALFEHPEIDRVLDTEALSYYLSLNYVPAPYTLVRGITKLQPGHWLEWRDGEVESECYWQHRVWPEARHTLDSAREELDHLLKESIREHLLSDVPLGVWSSGGLDSTTILHYATAHAGRRLKTFSVSFPGRKFDESEYFRQVARAYDTEHHEFELNPPEDLPGVLEQIAYYSDEPSADAGAVPVWYLSRMCREHVTVALSGDGADELFAGYNTYLADAYARRARLVPAALRRAALRGLGLWPASNDKISFEYKLKRFLEGSLLDEPTAHLSWNGTHTDAERKAFYREEAGLSVSKLYAQLPQVHERSGPLNRYLWLDQRFYLADDILYKVDRMSMAHSLEVRPPFLDHRIIDFANSLPEDLKIRGGSLKFLLRHLMHDRLPQGVLTRKKEGFDIPAHHWMRTVLRPMLLDTLNESAVTRMGLFHWPTMKERIEAHMAHRSNSGYHLWGLLTLFLWMNRWNIQVDGGLPQSSSSLLPQSISSASSLPLP